MYKQRTISWKVAVVWGWNFTVSTWCFIAKLSNCDTCLCTCLLRKMEKNQKKSRNVEFIFFGAMHFIAFFRLISQPSRRKFGARRKITVKMQRNVNFFVLGLCIEPHEVVRMRKFHQKVHGKPWNCYAHFSEIRSFPNGHRQKKKNFTAQIVPWKKFRVLKRGNMDLN